MWQLRVKFPGFNLTILMLRRLTFTAWFSGKEVLTKPIPNSCDSMDTASNVEAETNDSASSMSFNEFET